MGKYSKIVLGRYLYIPRRELRDYRAAVRAMTLKPKYDQSRSRVELFAVLKDWFGVPLYWFKHPESLAEKVIDQRVDGHAVRFEFTSQYWPGQEDVIRKFQRLIACGKTGILFEAPPGFGKTVVLIKMLQLLERTALIVVPRSNLVKQWRERLLEHTNLDRSHIGWAEGGKASWRGKTIVVGLVHTLALDRFGPDFRKYFGAVVFDEVDRSVPPATFAPVVTMFPARYRIGASATLRRQDGLEDVFGAHIGESHIRGADANRMEPTVLMVTYHGENLGLWEGLGRLEARGVIISNLAKNVARNVLLARYIAMIWKSGRRCLVLSDRTLQLALLRDILSMRFKIPLSDIGFYCQNVPVKVNGKYVRLKKKKGYKSRPVSEQERDSAASACKILLATYGKFAIGSDVPDLAGLVCATPQSETEQSKGRIERFVDGKSDPVVVDLEDTFYPETMRWAKNRIRQYRKSGLEIKRYEVK